jgi:hypothetical protein
VVRLIPGFDPYLLGWRERDLAVPASHRSEVFPGGGMLRPTLLVDGLAQGTWSAARRPGRLTITVRAFGTLGPALRRSLADEAADLGRFHGAAVDVTLV